jgi:hypothetical protein
MTSSIGAGERAGSGRGAPGAPERHRLGTLSVLFLRDPDGVMVELVERDSGIFK